MVQLADIESAISCADADQVVLCSRETSGDRLALNQAQRQTRRAGAQTFNTLGQPRGAITNHDDFEVGGEALEHRRQIQHSTIQSLAGQQYGRDTASLLGRAHMPWPGVWTQGANALLMQRKGTDKFLGSVSATV